MFLNILFDGRTIASSDFEHTRTSTRRSTTGCSRRRRASPGRRAYRAYGDLDVMLSRDAAPAIPFAGQHMRVRLRASGCVVMNPSLDLTAVCLK